MQMYGLKITAAAARTLQAAVVTHHLKRYNSHPYRDTASKPMVETAAVHYRPSCKVPSKTTGWKSQQGLQMGSSKFRETRSQDNPRTHTLKTGVIPVVLSCEKAGFKGKAAASWGRRQCPAPTAAVRRCFRHPSHWS